MINIKKKALYSILTLCLSAVTSVSAYDDISVYVDGELVPFETSPRIINDRTMVPVREIFEALDASIVWNEGDRTVTAYKDGIQADFIIGRDYFVKDGSVTKLDAPAIIEDDKTFVPLRALSETFGCSVTWDEDTYSVVVSSSGYETILPSRYTLALVPEYIGEPYTVINDNEPYFTDEDLTTETFAVYENRDRIGRTRAAFANLSVETMPVKERDSIEWIKPTGWHSVRYDFIDGGYLYNRCHLIGYQLAGENDETKNFITGTKYMNNEGMLPFENETAQYLKDSGNHVLYRVTPAYNGNDLVAGGVFMEALSVEDEGDFRFNVFCYNVQPGVEIDYATGVSRAAN